MLKVYQQQNGGLRGSVLVNSDPVPPGAIWFDLFDPSAEERLRVNALLGVEMPTRADDVGVGDSNEVLWHERVALKVDDDTVAILKIALLQTLPK